MLSLYYEKITVNAFEPTKGSEDSAGYDLYSAYDYNIEPNNKEMIKTDLKIALPFGTYGRIAPRSGLAWFNSINVMGGVIDRDYRGNICVILFNHSNHVFNVKKGDRIAQLIVEMIAKTRLIEAKLDSTERKDKGFGSTGK